MKNVLVILLVSKNDEMEFICYRIQADDYDIKHGFNFLRAVNKAEKAGFKVEKCFDEFSPAGRQLMNNLTVLGDKEQFFADYPQHAFYNRDVAATQLEKQYPSGHPVYTFRMWEDDVSNDNAYPYWLLDKLDNEVF